MMSHPELDKSNAALLEFYSSVKWDKEPKWDGKSPSVNEDGSITSREDVNAKAGIEKYGSVKFADSKNKKYPLDTPEHVRSAASYFGMPKNRSKYSQEGQAIIDRRIRAAKKKYNIGEGR